MRNLKSLIAYEAKRRPEVAALVERAATLTDEEIENAKVPLPWYRKALRELRADAERLEVLSPEMLEALHNNDNYTDIASDNETMGQVFRYMGENFFQQSGGWQVEITHGELFYFHPSGVAWFGETRVARPPAALNNSQHVGDMTRGDYIEFRMQSLIAKHGLQPMPEPPQGIAQSNTNGYGNTKTVSTSGVSVTIKRH